MLTASGSARAGGHSGLWSLVDVVVELLLKDVVQGHVPDRPHRDLLRLGSIALAELVPLVLGQLGGDEVDARQGPDEVQDVKDVRRIAVAAVVGVEAQERLGYVPVLTGPGYLDGCRHDISSSTASRYFARLG